MADLLNPKDEMNLGRQARAEKPLEDTANVLRSLAADPGQPLDPAVKAKQRAALMAKFQMPTTHFQQSPQPSIPAPSSKLEAPSRAPGRPWFLWAGAFATAAIAIVLAVVLSRTDVLRPSLPVGGLKRLVIPEARAADAFQVIAEEGDTAGVAVGGGFTLKTAVSVKADDLRQTLRIVPAIAYAIESDGPGQFRIKPEAPLDPGTVYQVTLAAEVAKTDGTRQNRDFSWAFQTKDTFRVLSTIPGDRSSGVPVNTGIELKLSMAGWSDATSSFEIIPPVAGRFETHGRTLVFVPEKPLAFATAYQVRLKQGFGISGSNLTLPEDRLIRFETQAAVDSGSSQAPLQLDLGEYQEVVPGQALSLPVYVYGDRYASTTVDVTGYALSDDAARELLEARQSIPEWTPLVSRAYQAYRDRAKNQAFTAAMTLEVTGSYGYVLRLPKIDRAGTYAVRLQPKGGLESWMFLQVTDLAAYIIADRDQVYVWTLNASSRQPLSNHTLTLGDASALSDASGIARLPAPAFLATSTPDANAHAILEATGTGGHLFSIVRRSGGWLNDFGGYQPGWATTWGYLYPDRPLYHPADEIHFFGVAQDRATRQGIGKVTVKLQKESFYYDYGTGESHAYQEATLDTDAAGRFDGTFAWTSLSPGFYRIALERDGQLVTTRSFEVREFVKPSWNVSVALDPKRVYAGQAVHATVSASFYDGTPVPHAKLELQIRQGGRGNLTREVTTDGSGRAVLDLETNANCQQDTRYGCPMLESLTVEARPTTGEEGEIVGYGDAEVYPSSLRIEADTEVQGLTAKVKFTATHIDFSKDDTRGEPWGERTVKAAVTAEYWERIQTGVTYDFIQKKTVPQYRYEQRTENAGNLETQTDATGHASLNVPMRSDRSYRILIQSLDDQGRTAWATTYASPDAYTGYQPGGTTAQAYANLAFDGTDSVNKEMAPGETAGLTYRIGNQPLDTLRASPVLYVVSSRGVRQVKVSPDARYQLTFDESMAPNADIRAVAWRNGHFETVRAAATQKRDTRALQLDVQADQESYAPGGRVRLRVTVKQKESGEPARNVKVAFAAIDKALSGVAYLYDEDPVGSLYGYVPDGVVFENETHAEGGSDVFGGAGGAEKGGGGGDVGYQNVRRIFKDTAAFGVVETDGNGGASLEFTAPDNLTTWRVQTIAVSDRLDAGGKVTDVRVTKPLFVEAVLPPRLLASDQPVIKVRAFGAALPEGSAVNFTIDAPTLGLHNQSATGTANVPAYFSVAQLPAGHHVLTIGVLGAGGTDRVERTLDVATTRYAHEEYVSVDPAPGSGLPDLGAPEAELVIQGKGRSAYLPFVQGLAYGSGPRIDQRIAAKLMRDTLQTVYGETVEGDAPTITDGQDFDGGIRLLPYASSDLELTAEAAATAPTLFDTEALKAYLWKSYDQADASRSVRIQALAGLAALREPILPVLEAAASETDLGWREQLALSRGLVAAGDLERARALLDQLLTTGEERDAVLRLNVSTSSADVYEATADAAALAIALSHPKAQALHAYVESNWSADAFPVLAHVRYLQAALAAVPTEDGSISWTIGGKTEETLNLKDEPTRILTLTADEARQFRVTKISGPVELQIVRRVAGRPTAVPEVSVSRTYAADHVLDALLEGDVVRVTLKPTWQERAQSGCYKLTDHLPGGWQAVVSWSSYQRGVTYPYDVSNGEVSFVTCKRTNEPTEITYLARIVSRGSYTAEAPLLEHLEHPSVAAIGQDQSITVK